MELYNRLGIQKNATKDEIKKAHRELVKQHHPDKGGDPDTFAKIQEAYEVLFDDERREKYDRTGDFKKVVDNFKQEFMSFISQTVLRELESSNNLDFDLIGTAVKVIDGYIKRGKEKIKQCNRQKEHLEKAILRVKRKDDGENLIAGVIQSQINAYSNAHNGMIREMELLDKFRLEFDNYEYEFNTPMLDKESTERIEMDMKTWLEDLVNSKGR